MKTGLFGCPYFASGADIQIRGDRGGFWLYTFNSIMEQVYLYGTFTAEREMFPVYRTLGGQFWNDSAATEHNVGWSSLAWRDSGEVEWAFDLSDPHDPHFRPGLHGMLLTPLIQGEIIASGAYGRDEGKSGMTVQTFRMFERQITHGLAYTYDAGKQMWLECGKEIAAQPAGKWLDFTEREPETAMAIIDDDDGWALLSFGDTAMLIPRHRVF